MKIGDRNNNILKTLIKAQSSIDNYEEEWLTGTTLNNEQKILHTRLIERYSRMADNLQAMINLFEITIKE